MINKNSPWVWRTRLKRRIQKRVRLYDLKTIDPAVGSLQFAPDQPGLTPWDFRLEHHGSFLQLGWNSQRSEPENFMDMLSNRCAPYLYYFIRAGRTGTTITCDFSDGNEPSTADIGFSSFFPDLGLVPDPYFFQTNAYAPQREQAASRVIPWSERSDDIVWRGGPNGTGLLVGRSDMTDNAAICQRVRLAYACQGTDIDVKFVAGRGATEVYKAQGLLGEHVPAETWLGRKYALDIDGNSNAWDNLFHRLLFGCCVLKVESQLGFRQWYYDKLKPFQHYVPIKADLSDLHQQVDWVRSHPVEAEALAHEGQALAKSLTFESEMEYAVQEVQKRCRSL